MAKFMRESIVFVVRVRRRKKFTFAISSSDELLVIIVLHALSIFTVYMYVCNV